MTLSDFETLASAKVYQQAQGRMVSPDMVISLLTQHDSVISLKLKAETDDKAAGFLLALSGSVTDFNVMTGHPVGDAQQLLLTYLVAIGAVTQSFKDTIIAYASPIIYPFINATEQDFKKAKGTITYKQVTPINGWLKITTNADCEAHNPQIYAEIQGIKRRVAGFSNVSLAGDYLAEVPKQYGTLFVDDAYQVII